MRTEAGVTSTSSSSLMNSMACSRLRSFGGMSCRASSDPAALILVSFFSFDDIDIEIILSRILTDHHPFVDGGILLYKERPPGLEVKERIGGRLSWPVCNQRSGRAFCKRAMPRLIAVEDMVEETRPSCIGEKLGTKADQPSGGNPEFEPDPAVAVVVHLLHSAFADSDLLGHELR